MSFKFITVGLDVSDVVEISSSVSFFCALIFQLHFCPSHIDNFYAQISFFLINNIIILHGYLLNYHYIVFVIITTVKIVLIEKSVVDLRFKVNQSSKNLSVLKNWSVMKQTPGEIGYET